MRSPDTHRRTCATWGRGLALLGLAAVAVACATVDWQGKTIDEVMAKLGRPTSVVPLPDGRRVFSFNTSYSVPGKAILDDKGHTVGYTQATSWQVQKTFVVDPDGIVLQVQ